MNKPSDMNETFRLDIPASLKYLNVLGACLTAVLARMQSIEDPDIVIYNIQLAIHEICTNIMIHAYARISEAGRIEVIITLYPREKSLRIDIFDNGEPFDEKSASEPDLIHGQLHGYGLFLVRNLMDSVQYQRQGDKNTWCLTKHL